MEACPVSPGLIELNERVQPMRLATKCLKLSALMGLLGISVWAIGCGEQSSAQKGGSVAPATKTGGSEAGSAKGGGVDVPDMPADPAKPEAGDAKDAPKGDDAKKEEPKVDEAKADEAKTEEPKTEDKKEEK